MSVRGTESQNWTIVIAIVVTTIACQDKPRTYDPAQDAGPTASLPVLLEAESPDLVPDWHLAWAKRVGGEFADIPWYCASDGSSIFATGWFSDNVVFGQGEPGETELFGGGGHMYLARYEPNGSLAWVAWAGDGYTLGTAVDAHEDETSVVAGCFHPSAMFGAGELEETRLESGPGCQYATFVASYRDDGTLAWVRAVEPVAPLPGPDDDCSAKARGAGVLSDGSALVAGRFEGQVALAKGTSEETTLVSAGDTDGFLARYDVDGNLLWVERIGGPGRDGLGSVAVLPAGEFYALGHFSGSVLVGQDEVNETELVAIGEDSVLLARYDSASALVWVSDLGIDGSVRWEVGGISVLPDGDVAVTGRFAGRMRAGDAEAWEWIESPEDGRGMFVARYTSAGEWVWTRTATCDDFYCTAWDVEPLSDGSMVVVGRYQGEAVFGAGEPNETTLEFHGGEMDAFLALYQANGDLQWVLGWGSYGADSFSGVEVIENEEEEVVHVYVSGFFEQTVTFGTGGGDEVELTAASQGSEDIVLLRFDRGEEQPQ